MTRDAYTEERNKIFIEEEIFDRVFVISHPFTCYTHNLNSIKRNKEIIRETRSTSLLLSVFCNLKTGYNGDSYL